MYQPFRPNRHRSSTNQSYPTIPTNLTKEGSAQVHDERFVHFRRVFCDLHDGRRADGQEEAGHVNELGLLDQRPVGLLLYVIEGEGVGGG